MQTVGATGVKTGSGEVLGSRDVVSYRNGCRFLFWRALGFATAAAAVGNKDALGAPDTGEVGISLPIARKRVPHAD